MRRTRFTFRAKLEPASAFAPNETGFVVTFPDWGWGATQGEDKASALTNAADCLEEMLAACITDGNDVPVAAGRLRPGEEWVTVGGVLAAKAALYLAMREAGVSNSDLARRLGCDEKEVRRLLSPKHGSKLPRLEVALKALGLRLLVDTAAA